MVNLYNDAYVSDKFFVWQEYEVKWHCVKGAGSYCPGGIYSYGWTTRTVNTTSLTVAMTRYNVTYSFKITVITSRGRGLPYQLDAFVPPLNGRPSNFLCAATLDNNQFVCNWTSPTDFNETGFYVSSKT